MCIRDRASREYRNALEHDKEMSQYIIDSEGANAPSAADWSEAEDRVRRMQEDAGGKAFSSTFSIRTGRASAAAAQAEAKRAQKRKDSGSKPASRRKLSRAAK